MVGDHSIGFDSADPEVSSQTSVEDDDAEWLTWLEGADLFIHPFPFVSVIEEVDVDVGWSGPIVIDAVGQWVIDKSAHINKEGMFLTFVWRVLMRLR